MKENKTLNTTLTDIDLLRLVRAMWQRLWVILLCTILCGIGGYCYASFGITPLYKASAMLYVNASSSVGSVTISSSELTTAKSLVDTYVVILGTRNTLEDVIEQADLDYTYSQLSSMVSASAVNSTEVFRITVTSTDPEEAKLIANTIVEVLPEKISDIVNGSSVKVVDYAVTPTAKSSPSISHYTVRGLLVGFLLSCAVIAVLELMDNLIHDEDYLMQTFNLPLLATVPDLLGSGGHAHYYYKHYRADYTAQQEGDDHAG